MYTKKSKMTENELVLVETQELQEKCGKCDTKLLLKVYWSKEGYHKKIECLSCKAEVWKE